MATTMFQPVRARIHFACKYHFPSEADVTAVEKIMRREDPNFHLLEPRPFGKLARKAMSEHWKL